MKATSWILSTLAAVALVACGGGGGEHDNTGGAGMETGSDAGTMADTTTMPPGATPADTALGGDTLADTATTP